MAKGKGENSTHAQSSTAFKDSKRLKIHIYLNGPNNPSIHTKRAADWGLWGDRVHVLLPGMGDAEALTQRIGGSFTESQGGSWLKTWLKPEKWLYVPLCPLPLRYCSPSRSAAETLVAMLLSKNCPIMVLALFTCKYLNHKWWKLNPENSPDPDTVTAPIWLLHMLSNVSSTSNQNQVHNAEAIPAIWKPRLHYCGADKTIVYTVPASTSAERGMWSSAFYWREPFVFCPRNTQSCDSRRNIGSTSVF